MLFNKDSGDIKELPFDLDRRRVSPFELKGENQGLTDLVIAIIKTIITKNPTRIIPNGYRSEAYIKRQRDIRNLELLFSTINIASTDYFISNLPKYIHSSIFRNFSNFESIINSNTFHLYDKALYQQIKRFHILWQQSLGSDQYFDKTGDSLYSFKTGQRDVEQFLDATETAGELQAIAFNLNSSFSELITFIRENYVEIDLEKLSQIAYDSVNCKQHKLTPFLIIQPITPTPIDFIGVLNILEKF